MDIKTKQMDLTIYTIGCDKSIQMDVTKLYKWKRHDYINRFDKPIQMNVKKTIQIDVTKLYQWIWHNNKNGCEKTIQMDVKRLYKWVWLMNKCD